MSRYEIDLEALNFALDKTFEAAVDQSLWPSVMEAICRATGSIGAHVVPVATHFLPGIPATPSMHEAHAAYFRDGWDLRDERYALSRYAKRKGIALDHDHFTEEDMRRLPYYIEFLGRYGFRHSANIAFPYNGALLNFALQRGVADDPFTFHDEPTLVRMQLRLTTTMQVMHGVHVARLSGVSEAFEVADIACVFFGSGGRVVKANAKAEKLLGKDVKIVSGELHGRTPDETKAIRGHVRAILDRRPFTDPLVSTPVVLTREEKRPLLLRTHRLSGFTLDIFSHAVAVGLLFDANEDRPVANSVLQGLFSLTRQEQEIARRLSSGFGLQEIADLQSVDYETVRTHVKNIMRKTDTSRQGELVALLNRIAGI